MNSNTSNPDEAKEATDKSTKKNIPGLALLLLDLAVLTVVLASSYHWVQPEIVHETRPDRRPCIGDTVQPDSQRHSIRKDK